MYVSKHPMYARWNAMMSRCYNENTNAHPYYGRRGIKVCKEWHDPWTFFAWAEKGFRPGLTLDRINNDGDYTPENCRWVTQLEQNRNRSGVRVARRQRYMPQAMFGLDRSTVAEIFADDRSIRAVAKAHKLPTQTVAAIRQGAAYITYERI